MSDNKYWQSFGELKGSEELAKKIENEFQEDLPFEDRNGKGWLDATAPRRDFLKYLGFSTAAAAIAAGCKTPVKKAIPFANKPADIVPGVSKYYATTYVQDGDVLPILAKVRDGRPIKIEGNNECAYTGGGTSARAQASVLDLYDLNRLTHPKRKVRGSFEEIPTFEQLDKMVGDALAGVTNPVLLTSTITSPTTKEIIAKFPGLKHVQYDADSFSGMLMANEATFGKRAIPSYNFAKAKVIVSLGADFLGTWLNPVEFARQYAQTRKLKDGAAEMSRHFQFESFMSMTGANADERFTHRPSEAGAVAAALLAAVTGSAGTSGLGDKAKAGITKAATELNANKGAAVVVSGSNDVNVQTIVNAINNAIGAYGSTIDWSTTLNFRQGTDAEFEQLLTDLNSGSVGAIMVYGANPAYNYHNPDKFKTAFAKARIKISFNEYRDETTELCDYVIPSHHYLESWGDAEPKSGYISFIQPTIHPLFKTRDFQTSLLKWSQPAGTTGGNIPIAIGTDYATYFKNYWETKLGSKAAFDAALQRGVIDGNAKTLTGTSTTADSTGTKPVMTMQATTAPSAGSFNSSTVEAAITGISGTRKGGAAELVLYQKVSIGTGKQGTNPWLQELPDPISKATWDNYAMMSMPMAKNVVGIDLIGGSEKHINDYEYFPKKPVVTITVPGKPAVELPVLIIPGMDPNTIAVAVGYGRAKELGKAAGEVGKNVYQFSSSNGTARDYYTPSVEVKDAGKEYKVAQVQVHNSYEDRSEVVKETSLASFVQDRKQFKRFREHLAADFAPKTGDFRRESTIYPDHAQPGLKWGMSVDMNSCTACGACVVACHAENNVPVVGKSEVARYHDMHWLRIDRYFVTNKENPDDVKAVVFQPMLCQHCDNAPCENVCPVAATNHSTEGLNQMTYNRCIGTRYCANNCPYKVRRFNWADYTGSDSFPNNRDQKLVGKLDPVVEHMNDDLTRMVLNPDVTVRSRGVIEKCSFCVQRLQEAKLDAKKANTTLADGKAVTACMQACPTEAIVFGNVHDKESRIAKTRAEHDERLFYVIEQIHTLPNVNYLAKIRNTSEMIESKIKEHAAAATHSTEETKPAATH
ncbi:MAG TPA: TAT-variant-translocated molybdopterin oxidoreductase [Chitinophagaceae bacterium]